MAERRTSMILAICPGDRGGVSNSRSGISYDAAVRSPFSDAGDKCAKDRGDHLEQSLTPSGATIVQDIAEIVQTSLDSGCRIPVSRLFSALTRAVNGVWRLLLLISG